MNLSSKILFWIFTIALGFVSPVISFVMIVLYYLPGLIQDISKNNTESACAYQPDSSQNQSKIKEFSKDVLEEFR